jgi:7-cyano-7-deazaguanine synthase
MCGIFGWMGDVPKPEKDHVLFTSQIRGRDGFGVMYGFNPSITETHRAMKIPLNGSTLADEITNSSFAIGNARATPTPEIETDKSLLQPYDGIVHNGTIANDKELAREIGIEPPKIDSMILPAILRGIPLRDLPNAFQRLRGGFAIAMVHKMQPKEQVRELRLVLAANYKPIYFRKHPRGIIFASTREMLGNPALPVDPYTMHVINPINPVHHVVHELRENRPNKKVAVCASSGLDSTTVAYMLQFQGYDVTLVHFQYGAVAEKREYDRIQRIQEHGKFALNIIDLPRILGGSLTEGHFHREGIEGSEYAYDWVASRNLIMLSLLLGYAETNDIDHIAFGGNLEESGSYPDNEEEFGVRFNDLIPYAVAENKNMKLLQPVARMMKKEIVLEGTRFGVPWELTWSCYGNGPEPCGECGPCFMRRTAFERCGITDPQLI